MDERRGLCRTWCFVSGWGTLLPGKLTIPEQVERDKRPYYKALEAADDAWAEGRIDLMAMKQLLSSMLARQLVAVHEDSELAGNSGRG